MARHCGTQRAGTVLSTVLYERCFCRGEAAACSSSYPMRMSALARLPPRVVTLSRPATALVRNSRDSSYRPPAAGWSHGGTATNVTASLHALEAPDQTRPDPPAASAAHRSRLTEPSGLSCCHTPFLSGVRHRRGGGCRRWGTQQMRRGNPSPSPGVHRQTAYGGTPPPHPVPGGVCGNPTLSISNACHQCRAQGRSHQCIYLPTYLPTQHPHPVVLAPRLLQVRQQPPPFVSFPFSQCPPPPGPGPCRQPQLLQRLPEAARAAPPPAAASR